MEAEFKRDEDKAKQDKRVVRDKVGERMRDIYSTEEGEVQHQNALVDAELDDDFNLQGNDDEYGGNGGDGGDGGDDGEFNQRGGDVDE